MSTVATLLDLLAILASSVAAWLWYLASRRKVHRLTIHETFDYHDLNRVIVAFNRASIRNERAALASAIAAAVVAADLFVGYVSA